MLAGRATVGPTEIAPITPDKRKSRLSTLVAALAVVALVGGGILILKPWAQRPPPDGRERRLKLLYESYHGEKWKELADASERFLGDYGDDVAVLNLLTVALGKVRPPRWEGSLGAAKRATKLDPESADGWANRGLAALWLHDYAEARMCVEKAKACLEKSKTASPETAAIANLIDQELRKRRR